MGTAAGIKHLRRLQIGRCGGLRERALLTPDCCPCYPTFCPLNKNDDQIILLFVHMTVLSFHGLSVESLSRAKLFLNNRIIMLLLQKERKIA